MNFTGPNGALQVLGVTLMGLTPENGKKLLLTLAAVLLSLLFARVLQAALRLFGVGSWSPPEASRRGASAHHGWQCCVCAARHCTATSRAYGDSRRTPL
jgi:hypothetical protein